MKALKHNITHNQKLTERKIVIKNALTRGFLGEP